MPRFAMIFGMALLVSAGNISYGGVLMLSLSSSSDLASLQLGDSFTVDVNLDGLGDPGSPSALSSLGLSVGIPTEFNGPSLESVPVDSIVPDPFDVIFLSTPDLFFDAQFFAFTDNIASNGRFVSFDLTAVSAGAGTLGISQFPFAEDGAFPPNAIFDIDLVGLEYEVSSSASVVPEPATATCFALLMGVAVCGRRSRSKRLAAL